MKGKHFQNRLYLILFLFTIGVASSLVTAHADEYMHEHQWEVISQIDPTCENNGECTRRCLTCGDVETIMLGYLGHVLDTPELDTYNFLSDTDFRYCSQCGKRIAFKRNSPFNPPVAQPKPPSMTESLTELSGREKEIYGHDPFTVDEYLEWLESIRNNGFYSTTAVVEYEDEYSENHPDKKHVFPFLPADATCTTWGHFVYLPCPYCGLSYHAATGKAEFGYYPDEHPLGHDFRNPYYGDNPPTCTLEGEVIIECQNGCGVKLTETVPAMGHTVRYEKPYQDGDSRTIPGTVFCEICQEEFHPSIAGYVWKDSRGEQGAGPMPKDLFRITFKDESGRTYDAEYVSALYFGYYADLPSGKYTMNVTAEGYNPLTHSVTVEKGTILDFDVYLDGSGRTPDDGNNKINDYDEKKTDKPTDEKNTEMDKSDKRTSDTDFDSEEGSNKGLLIAIAAISGAALAGGAATFIIRKRR